MKATMGSDRTDQKEAAPQSVRLVTSPQQLTGEEVDD